MKKHLLISLAFLLQIQTLVWAGEGMYIPSKIDSMLLSKMKATGFSLNAEDIYSDTGSSMKDAVVLFGRGCTGEIISDQGLLLTNYHCGQSQIQSRSSLESDYLKNGFWALDASQEIPCPGLNVTFIISITDVTSQILAGLNNEADENERVVLINKRSDSLVTNFINGTHYKGFVKSYYYGNRYFLFVTEEFSDVRLVGAPPSSIGNFGGETDNWVWPRHTADFALFRVYASKDNKPSEYSPENKPFTPRYFFPISLKGYKENDFTLVYGFPGTTSMYLSSGGVHFIEEELNPSSIAIREQKLKILDDAISSNDTIRLKYSSLQRRIANYYKKWQGERQGVLSSNTINEKIEFENRFRTWAKESSKPEYVNVVDSLNSIYAQYGMYKIAKTQLKESFWDIQTNGLVKQYLDLDRLLANKRSDSKDIQRQKAKFQKQVKSHFDSYHKQTDRSLFISMIAAMYTNMDEQLRPGFLKGSLNGESITKFAANAYDNSIFTDRGSLEEMLQRIDYKKSKMLRSDPLLKMIVSANDFETSELDHKVHEMDTRVENYMGIYMKGIVEMNGEDHVFPDANRTLRVSFGKIEGFEPKDGINYKYYTTAEGIIQKGSLNNPDYMVDTTLTGLINRKDYGIYGKGDTLITGFIASNHTTGGNSGSPVLNANGELIGTNFDRVWEGTMSDIKFDPSRCRNITLDIRYTLFIIDKYAGCHRLINELHIIE